MWMYFVVFLCVTLPSITICVSLFSGTHKPKDPPWLALVQSEPKKKKAPAPPPPPAGLATPPNTGSLSSLKGEGSRPSTPPQSSNPFEDDDDENNEGNGEEGSEGGAPPATVVSSHPWYSITQAADAVGADTPTNKRSSSRSVSPASTKSKKRPAPRAPRPPTSNQGQFYQNHKHQEHPLCALQVSNSNLTIWCFIKCL